MIYFIIAVVILGWQAERILRMTLLLWSSAKNTPTEADTQLVAEKRRLTIYLSKHLPIESLIFSQHIIIHESLWNQLTLQEQESLLFWSSYAIQKNPFWWRLGGFFRPDTIDRDTALRTSPDPFISLCRKAGAFHQNLPGTPLSGLLGGLSFMGSPWLETWPACEQRVENLIHQIMELQDNR